MSNFKASKVSLKNATTGTVILGRICNEDGTPRSEWSKGIIVRASHTFDLNSLGLTPGNVLVVEAKVRASVKKPKYSKTFIYEPDAGSIGVSVEGRLNKWEVVGPYAAVNA